MPLLLLIEVQENPHNRFDLFASTCFSCPERPLSRVMAPITAEVVRASMAELLNNKLTLISGTSVIHG
jgi:hypothetical protein